jgi:hypothetical protein
MVPIGLVALTLRNNLLHRVTLKSSPDQIDKNFSGKPNTQTLLVKKRTTSLPAFHNENNTADE